MHVYVAYFYKLGRFQQCTERIYMKSQLENLRNEISQIVKKIRESQKLQNCKMQLN